MKRTIELRVKVPDILMYHPVIPGEPWSTAPEDSLRFDFREGEIEGVIALNLSYGVEPNEPLPGACGEVVVEIRGDWDPGIDQEHVLLVAQRLTHSYVNRLLSYVRVGLGQHWVRSIPISEWELMYFVHETKPRWVDAKRKEEVLRGRATQLAIPPAMSFDAKWWPLYGSERDTVLWLLEHWSGWPPERELMANAKEYFVASEYRMAAVEGAAALEVGLERFVRAQCKAKRIAGKLRDVSGDLGAAAYLKLLLPLQLTEDELLCCRGLINRCDKLRKIRNKVVHEAESPEDGQVEDIRLGIEAAEQLLDFIGQLARSRRGEADTQPGRG